MVRHRIAVTIGLGVDILRTSRFQRLLLEKNEQFVTRLALRVLHNEHEYPKFIQLQQNDIKKCINYISGSWAAKEALFKTLETDEQQTFQFKDWYRYHDSNGKPYISNTKYTQDEVFLLSVSHDDDILVANVLRQKFIEI